MFVHTQNMQHKPHSPLHQHRLLENEAELLLRDVLIVQNEGMLNISLLRVNRCHAEDFHARAEVASWWDILVHFNSTPHLDQASDTLLWWEADIGMVRHNEAHQSWCSTDLLCNGKKVKCVKTTGVDQVSRLVSFKETYSPAEKHLIHRSGSSEREIWGKLGSF